MYSPGATVAASISRHLDVHTIWALNISVHLVAELVVLGLCLITFVTLLKTNCLAGISHPSLGLLSLMSNHKAVFFLVCL